MMVLLHGLGCIAGKMPKNAVPGEEPDPNRWLPKWQRRAKKNRRKKGRGKHVRVGTQGADVSEADMR